MSFPDSGDVARMQRIIDRLRSYGVTVREMPGWQTRGFRYPVVPTRVFDHHDASSRKSGEWGSLGLILDGTPRGIPGPLSNFEVARCLDNVPKVAVVAAGYCYHAGAGGPWNELPYNDANPRTYGAEKANDGLGEPYTAAANYATNALFHACAVESSGTPATFPLGHKEWTTRKSDPTYSMPDRRRQVAAFTVTPQGDNMPLNTADLAAVMKTVWSDSTMTLDGVHVPFGVVLKSAFENSKAAAIDAAITRKLVEQLAKGVTLSDAQAAQIAAQTADEVAADIVSGYQLQAVPKPVTPTA